MDDLDVIAHRLGVRVEHWLHLAGGRWGDYTHHKARIRLVHDLDYVQYRSTYGHELGHAHAGHRRTTARTELEADVYAARILINHECWRRYTAAYDNVLSVAHELQVLPRLVEVYAKHLARHPAIRNN